MDIIDDFTFSDGDGGKAPFSSIDAQTLLSSSDVSLRQYATFLTKALKETGPAWSTILQEKGFTTAESDFNRLMNGVREKGLIKTLDDWLPPGTSNEMKKLIASDLKASLVTGIKNAAPGAAAAIAAGALITGAMSVKPASELMSRAATAVTDAATVDYELNKIITPKHASNASLRRSQFMTHIDDPLIQAVFATISRNNRFFLAAQQLSVEVKDVVTAASLIMGQESGWNWRAIQVKKGGLLQAVGLIQIDNARFLWDYVQYGRRGKLFHDTLEPSATLFQFLTDGEGYNAAPSAITSFTSEAACYKYFYSMKSFVPGVQLTEMKDGSKQFFVPPDVRIAQVPNAPVTSYNYAWLQLLPTSAVLLRHLTAILGYASYTTEGWQLQPKARGINAATKVFESHPILMTDKVLGLTLLMSISNRWGPSWHKQSVNYVSEEGLNVHHIPHYVSMYRELVNPGIAGSVPNKPLMPDIIDLKQKDLIA
jgi:hypothetical protein